MSQIMPYPTNNTLDRSERQNLIFQLVQVIYLGVRVLKFLFLSLLFVLAFVLWLWSISYQTGRLFREWYDEKQPTELQVTYKLGEIILFPFVLLRDWSLAQIDKFWGIKLPLITETQAPEKCSELSLFKNKTEENQ